MSTSAGKPESTASTGFSTAETMDKGKGKVTEKEDEVMEEEDEEEDDDEEEDEEEEGEDDEDEEMEEDSLEEIDVTAIRSTRRKRADVDYSSPSAWEAAGLKKSDDDKDE